MKILEKLKNSNLNIENTKVKIAFLGDSVTAGCFECYRDENDNLQTVHDLNSSYPQKTLNFLKILYPNALIEIKNAGVSGDNTWRGKKRFDNDISPFNPDLVVVSYGLNDAMSNKIDEYANNLDIIFKKAKEINAECIFLTENYMCTYVHNKLTNIKDIELAENISKCQNNGILYSHFDIAKKVAKENGIKVCDIYSYWEIMNKNDVDTTSLLSNCFNHPIKELHSFIAMKLIETLFE